MSFKSHCVTLALSALAFASVAAAQVPSKTTRYYRVPTDLNLWECCTPNEAELSFETLAEQTTRRRPVATYLGDRSTPVVSTMRSTCTNLSDLTPAERLRRQLSLSLGSCVRRAVYEHVVCSCENFCFDATFLCNCPGLEPGELPDTSKPQDSLGSQPELIAEMCTECSSESFVCGGETGGGLPD